MDIATLGLAIENDGAMKAIDATADKLDALGSTGDAAAAKLDAGFRRVGHATDGLSAPLRALQTRIDAVRDAVQNADLTDAKYVAQLRAQIATEEALARAIGATEAQYAELASATAALTVTKEVATATNATATAMRSVGSAATVGGVGIGRIRLEMGTLVGRLTGTSTAVGRVVEALGSMATGNVVMIGILGGIAALAYAWQKLAHDADDLSQKVADALDRMRQHTIDAQVAMGDLQIKAALKAKADAQKALQDALAGSSHPDAAVSGATVHTVDVVAVEKARAALAAANGDLFAAQQNKTQIDTESRNQSERHYADNLALLVKSNHAMPAERQRALALYKADLAEIDRLGKSQTDNVRRADLIKDSETLGKALFPKTIERDAKARMRALNEEANHIRTAFDQTLKDIIPSVADVLGKAIPLSHKDLARGALDDLRNTADPFEDLINRGHLLQTVLDSTNATRALAGKKPLAEGSQLTEIKKQALDMGQAMERAVLASNLPLREQVELLDEIHKKLKEIGATAKEAKTDNPSRIAQGVSYARSAADAINLFGSNPRAQQEANLLNTGANAIDDFTHGNIAQGVLAVASLAKQVFSLGRQSHEAARQVAEARDAVKNMLDTLAASVNHDALGGLLAQAKAADDARRKQINDDLAGKKKENERNAALQQDAALYAQSQQQIREQFAKNTQFDNQSLEARSLRAKGLLYNADLLDLTTKQQKEYNDAVLAGKDAAYLATLTQVQLAEKAKLANDAMTQLSNNPTGFFVERYLGEFATPRANPLNAMVTLHQSAPAPVTFDLSNAKIVVDATGNGKSDEQVAQSLVRGLHTIAGRTIGTNVPLSQVLDQMPS